MRHKITQSYWHKGYVFLFSRVEDPKGEIEAAGIWTTHKTDDDTNRGGNFYATKFQEAHDAQIHGLWELHVKETLEQRRAEGLLIDDRTGESQEILKHRK